VGVDVRSVTFVGKWVEDAEHYLVDKGLLEEGELDSNDGDFEGLDLKLDVHDVSCYSNEGYYVGFEVNPSDYKRFDQLLAKFKEITGEEGSVETFTYWF